MINLMILSAYSIRNNIKMKLIKIKAYVLKDGPGGTYNVQYKHGNRPIRCDSFKIRDMDGRANHIRDPINWIEDMSPIPVPRALSPVRSYYFSDAAAIWVKIGHSMDVLAQHIKNTLY